MTSLVKEGREHLFVSYATEDWALAEWLTLKLTTEGYKVWCDRTKMLGGESYPVDIPEAIRNSTFRQIALLSQHSIKKANPVKERTIAMNVGKELGIKGFIIPVNVDGIAPVNLDLITTDLVYIPFHKGWAEGLRQLLKKLRQVDAPRTTGAGKDVVAKWLCTEESLVNREEKLWTNVIPILKMPEAVTHYFFPSRNELDSIEEHWAFYRQDPHNAWAFGPPPQQVTARFGETRSWVQNRTVSGISSANLVSYLLRRIMRINCARRGMLITADGRDIYFPKGLVSEDKLYFKRYDGRSVYIKTVGEITFRKATGVKEKSRYYLAPFTTPLLSRFGDPAYQLNYRIRWTDLNGVEYPRGTSLRRRKRLTKNWWNYQWLSRVTAFASWLCDGKDQASISDGSADIIVSGKPTSIASPLGIEEDVLYSTEEGEEEELELDEMGAVFEEEEEEDLGENVIKKAADTTPNERGESS
jgi:TIR domain